MINVFMFTGDVVLYNIFYEIFTACTSIVAHDSDGMSSGHYVHYLPWVYNTLINLHIWTDNFFVNADITNKVYFHISFLLFSYYNVFF